MVGVHWCALVCVAYTATVKSPSRNTFRFGKCESLLSRRRDKHQQSRVSRTPRPTQPHCSSGSK
ncbi:hypothetical protein E2C01_093212 [Portunus trituberculatus]|uniref:Secreted protein n=1 Tax=Portunus trituberculatus TaxID=210409 RepID=A0A5B7JZX5_PORTR|nr:hypothetical protein [Portunus trituberculatus]